MSSRAWYREAARGFTFIELLVTTAVLMVLASAALPLARVTVQRQREVELRRELREMRGAIDKFKDMADTQIIAPSEVPFGSEGYPATLQMLVDGVARNNDATGTKIKLLRRIPIDPMTRVDKWGFRSYQDSPDSSAWGGQNVFDVYSKSEGTALDGSKYKDW
ncbi:MAG: type II secretion system protein [Acidobacteria bacterium]|jgi:general secretion pathway protein G|nr:type II secretion system protein [Acidobacteriota bacterium]